jgi:hypothetical protein
MHQEYVERLVVAGVAEIGQVIQETAEWLRGCTLHDTLAFVQLLLRRTEEGEFYSLLGMLQHETKRCLAAA